MKRLPKISYLAAALATVVGTNTILLTPTFAAVDDTTTFNFGEVEYNNSSPKTVTSLYQQQRGSITEGSDAFEINCGWTFAYYCAVSVKDNLDASETPYTGIATINNKTYALSATVIPRDVTIFILGSHTTKTYNGEEQAADFDLSILAPSDYSKDFVKDNNPVTRTNAGSTTRALNDTDFENTNPNFNVNFKISLLKEYQSSTITINKAEINPSLSISDIQYGDELTPVVTGNVGNGTETIYYRTAGSTDWATTVPTEPGEYEAYADIAETDNYNRGASATTAFEITKRAVTVNVTGNSKEVTYNGKTQELQGLKIDFTDSIYDASKISVNGLALETLKAKEVGVYENTLEEEWFTNLDEEHFDVTFNVVSGTLTIKEAPVVNPITPSVKTASVLSPETGFNTTIANTAGSNTNISENILATAVIILASVATLGLYSLIRRHNN